jgi:LEA14-like dessication related protein
LNKYLLIILTVFLLASCKTQGSLPEGMGIKEPEFEIVSIIIIQADLVNTQFEAILKIENPNEFDAHFSSIKYELYGNDMFWAEGIAAETVLVPAESSVETKFRFNMNFINMNRRLLDDVISMRQIQYRFMGSVQVSLRLLRHAPYTVSFDISGMSGVKPKAED